MSDDNSNVVPLTIDAVHNIDCIKGMRLLKSNSVDLIIMDPPYFNIMKSDHAGRKFNWDCFDTMESYLSFMRDVFLECRRVLKDNGSLYCFCDDKIVSYIQIELDKFDWVLLNHIIWWKRNNMTIKGWANLRSYAAVTERILFYGAAEADYQKICDTIKTNVITGKDGIVGRVYEPIRLYLLQEKNKTGLNSEQINRLVGVASVAGRHYFSQSQWVFPTKEHYARMQLTFNVVYKKIATVDEASLMDNVQLTNALRGQEYDVLRQKYDVLRQEYDVLRRPFKQIKNHTDVWNYPITSTKEKKHGYHPTQKPVALIRRIIECSSRPGMLVLDPFMGSGTTAVACHQLGRKFIGFEIDSDYVKIANSRLAQSSLVHYDEHNERQDGTLQCTI